MTLSSLAMMCLLSFFGATAHGYRTVCYYTNWAQYRSSPAKFTVDNINPKLCTHLIYAFAKLNGTNIESYEYNDPEMYVKFNNLKVNNSLQTLLSVGGYTAGRAPFAAMTASKDNRAAFIKSAIVLLRNTGFDGLDIDWEYALAEDKQNFQLLVQEIAGSFAQEALNTRKPRLLLSLAVPAGISTIEAGYDIAGMDRFIDLWNIMTYDYHGPWETTTNLATPLYDKGDQLSVNQTINYYLSKGASPGKMQLGVAFYAKTWSLNGSNTDIGAPANGPGSAGVYTKTMGTLAYYEVCDVIKNQGLVAHFENTSGFVSYGSVNGQWITWEDIASLTLKVNYAKDHLLGGVTIWALDFDDFIGQWCGQTQYPLTSLVSGLLSSESSTATSTASSSETWTSPGIRSSSVVSSSPVVGSSPVVSSSPVVGSSPVVSSSSVTTASVASSTFSTAGQNTTLQLATSPSTAKCSGMQTFIADSSNCSFFQVCLAGVVIRRIQCPPGAIFNPTSSKCEPAATTRYLCPLSVSTTRQQYTSDQPTFSSTFSTVASSGSYISTILSETSPTESSQDSSPSTTSIETTSTSSSFTTSINTISNPAATSSSSSNPASGQSTTTPASQCTKKFGYVADPNCDYFLVCSSFQVTSRVKCPEGSIFNPAVSKCESKSTTNYKCPA